MISQPYISAGPKYHVQTSALTFNSIQFFSKIKEREREKIKKLYKTKVFNTEYKEHSQKNNLKDKEH